MSVFLYMVELELSDMSRQSEWEAWHEMHVRELLRIPGFLAGQRFRLVYQAVLSYLAVYMIKAADVITTEPYVSRAGPASALTWHGNLRNWRRKVLRGPEEASCVCSAHSLHLVDRHSEQDPVLPPGYIMLLPVALDQSVIQRGLRLMDREASMEVIAQQPPIGKIFTTL